MSYWKVQTDSGYSAQIKIEDENDPWHNIFTLIWEVDRACKKAHLGQPVELKFNLIENPEEGVLIIPELEVVTIGVDGKIENDPILL